MCAPASTVTRARRQRRPRRSTTSCGVRPRVEARRERCRRAPSASRHVVRDPTRRAACAARVSRTAARVADVLAANGTWSSATPRCKRHDRLVYVHGRGRSSTGSRPTPISRSLCVDDRPLDRAVREHAGEPGVRVGNDALGFVGDHRRHAPALAQLRIGGGVGGPPRAETDDEQRLARVAATNASKPLASGAATGQPHVGRLGPIDGAAARAQPCRHVRRDNRGGPVPAAVASSRNASSIDRGHVVRRRDVPDHFVTGASSAR